jgi:hypothetical protein
VGKAITSMALFVCLAMFLLGCSWGQTTSPMDFGAIAPIPHAPQSDDSLGVLNWTASIAILGGLISMILSSGRIGMRAIICGCCLIVLSYSISVYANLILLPVAIVITIVSAVLGYVTIVKAWNGR